MCGIYVLYLQTYFFLFINVYSSAIAEAEGEGGYPLNRLKPQVIFYITDRSKALLLIWFSLIACFGVSLLLFSPFFFLDDI